MKNERLLDGEKVTLVRIYDYYSTPKVCGMMGGRVDGKTVLDENGKPMPFSKIGELEGIGMNLALEKKRYK